MDGESLPDIADTLERQAMRLRALAEALTTEPELQTAAERLDAQALVLREIAAEFEAMDANPNLSPEARALLRFIAIRRLGDAA